MSQNPKRKKKRLLPKDITKKSDAEIIEAIFGKRVKRELDRILEHREVADKNKDVPIMD